MNDESKIELTADKNQTEITLPVLTIIEQDDPWSPPAQRSFTVVKGIPYYLSSGQSSKFPGTWFPYFGMGYQYKSFGKDKNIATALYLSDAEKNGLSAMEENWLIKAEALFLRDIIKRFDQDKDDMSPMKVVNKFTNKLNTLCDTLNGINDTLAKSDQLLEGEEFLHRLGCTEFAAISIALAQRAPNASCLWINTEFGKAFVADLENQHPEYFEAHIKLNPLLTLDLTKASKKIEIAEVLNEFNKILGGFLFSNPTPLLKKVENYPNTEQVINDTALNQFIDRLKPPVSTATKEAKAVVQALKQQKEEASENNKKNGGCSIS